MATLLIAEFPGYRLGRTQQPVVTLPALADQAVTFTTTTQSAALSGSTCLVRLVASAACHIAVGTNPTATTSNAVKLAADSPEYFEVKPGHIIAVVAA